MIREGKEWIPSHSLLSFIIIIPYLMLGALAAIKIKCSSKIGMLPRKRLPTASRFLTIGWHYGNINKDGKGKHENPSKIQIKLLLIRIRP